VNLAMLLAYKYAGFVVQQVNAAAGVALPVPFAALPSAALPSAALPLGVSFFTFQGISYLVDISRGTVPAQRSLLTFAMYKTMFPQLVAGPIVRYARVAGRMGHRSVSAWRMRTGLLMVLFGLAQKIVIADTVAGPADAIFALPVVELTLATAWAGAACYTVQIFFDFAGYSRMAIGLGHMMGFSFPANFNRPYAAQSVTAFWQRWHISLSTWFRDYLYIPMGGSRRGKPRTYVNLGSVFVLCGLWHGAAWSFALWGVWHGVFLVTERAGLGAVIARIWRPLRHVYVMAAVGFGWVLFRADGVGPAGHFMAAMLGAGEGDSVATPLAEFMPASAWAALLAGGLICAVRWPTERAVQYRFRGWMAGGLADSLASMGVLAVAMGLAGLSALSLASGTFSPFIYFRF
jgi:alginate O-acetyltransferase complex protein AlgI